MGEETMPVEQQEYEEIPQEIVKDISSPDVVKEDLSEIPSKDDISNANVESVPQKDITEKEDSNINIQQIPQDFVSDNEAKSDDKNKEADMGREEQEESKMVKKIENKVAKDKKKVAQEAMIESEQKEKAFPFGKKLKKAETVKLQIKETKLELPKLKHHEFENIPKDTDEEQLSNIKLSKLIKTENEESKIKKEETKRKLKKKKAKTPVQDVVEPMDMEEEETMPVEQQEYEEIPQEIVKDISSPDVVKEDLSEIPSKD